jgi:hypothetical protein
MLAPILSPLTRVWWTRTTRASCGQKPSENQQRAQRRGKAGVAVGALEGLVGNRLQLDDQAAAGVHGFDLVLDRRDRAPLQHSTSEIEEPFMIEQLSVADVKRFVVDEQTHALGIGDVDHCLLGLRIAIAGLGVRQRAHLAEAVEVRTRQILGLAFVQVATQAEVPVGEREDGLALGEHREIEAVLANVPGVDWVSRVRGPSPIETFRLRR